MLIGRRQTKKSRVWSSAHSSVLIPRNLGSSSSSADSDEAEEAESAQPPEDDSVHQDNLAESNEKPVKRELENYNEEVEEHSEDEDPHGAPYPDFGPAIFDTIHEIDESPSPQQELDQRQSEDVIDEYVHLLNTLTISRDQTEASNFEKERLLAIEDEKLIESAAIDPYPLPVVSRGNHALQDYQMQLMLLEQQNKKRLLTAHQDQITSRPGPSPPQSFSPDSPPPTPSQTNKAPRSSKLPMAFPYTPGEEPRPASPSTNTKITPDSKMPSSPRPNIMSTLELSTIPSSNIRHTPKTFQPDTRSGMLRPPSSRSPQHMPGSHTNGSSAAPTPVDALSGTYGGIDSDHVDQLLKRIEALERENQRLLHRPALIQAPKPPRFQVLHVLDDPARTICLQEPVWTFDRKGKLQLKAELPLVDLETHLKRNDDISFLVYKSYATPFSISNTDLAEILETGVMPDPEPSDESIEIRSEGLRAAFEIFLRSTGAAEEKQYHSRTPSVQAPYLFWYHCRSQHQALSQLHPEHQQQLKLLVDWIETNYAVKYDQFDEMISQGRISHSFMEYLFRTGDVVVSMDGDKTRAYRLDGIPALERSYGRAHHSQAFDKVARKKLKGAQNSTPTTAWRWNVHCWSIKYDGQFYRQRTQIQLEFATESHNDEVDISELSVIPLRLVGEEVQQQLMQRGCTFWSCRIKKLVSYKGGEEGTLHSDGERYMIDNKSYKKLHLDAQKSKRNHEIRLAYEEGESTPLFAEEMANDEPPPAPLIYLFPPTITGFSLRRKRWTDLVVDKITDVSWNKDAFKRLVADDKTKELVQALVADRIAGERNTDLIQGKGNGLIILLHGGPGTGKTFTAESVAELAEKPLYPVTCGDIGIEPEQVEKYLESVLYLGNIWDCVVLLDEADVFLEEREIADLARNALVSVFLRVLEYYDGILILTSNRVGTFDEAFKSRISLALHYPNFTKSQRCRIWKNFLNRLKDLKEPNIDFDDIECNVIELAEEELNGRQIRNAITIGRQLAKFQEKDLSYAHLKHVVEVSAQFETYVKKTKEDLTDEQVARLHGRRW